MGVVTILWLAVVELLEILDFCRKRSLRAKASKVAGTMAYVERDQGKKAKTDAVARAVIGETINLFLTKIDKQIVTFGWKF